MEMSYSTSTAVSQPLLDAGQSSPPIMKGRNLVLCFDGTTNRFGQEGITNVIRVHEILRKDTPSQLCYYQAGIGTYDAKVPVGSTEVPIKTKISKGIDAAFANGIRGHILGGYKYLMQHWRPGDKIYMFGFSRGAYTARALAGMLEKVGLLSSGNEEQVPFAWEMNKTTGNREQAAEFRAVFSQAVAIHFLGLWDTVQSTGFLRNVCLPDPGMISKKSQDYGRRDGFVRFVYHALALDEKRIKFEPLYYDVPKSWTKTSVYERWFVGDHSDVGGRFAYLERSGSHKLANPSFRWIVRAAAMASDPECFLFHPEALLAYYRNLVYGTEFPCKATPENMAQTYANEPQKYMVFVMDRIYTESLTIIMRPPTEDSQHAVDYHERSRSFRDWLGAKAPPELPDLATEPAAPPGLPDLATELAAPLELPDSATEPAALPRRRPWLEMQEMSAAVHDAFDDGMTGRLGWSILQMLGRKRRHGQLRPLPSGAILHPSVRAKMIVDPHYGGHRRVRLLKCNADEDVADVARMSAKDIRTISSHASVKPVKREKTNENDYPRSWQHAYGIPKALGMQLGAEAAAGHVQNVNLLLENGAEVNIHGPVHITALQCAAWAAHEETVRLLLSHNADVNAVGGKYGTALQCACRSGSPDVVKLLLDAGASVNAVAGKYGTALQCAARFGHGDIVRMLLDQKLNHSGLNVNATEGGLAPAIQLMAKWGAFDVVRLLLVRGADVTLVGKDGETALQSTALSTNPEACKVAEELLGANADVNAPGGEFGTALQCASHSGNMDIVQLLLRNRANVNAPPGPSGTALQCAAYFGHSAITEVLLEEGADVNAPGAEQFGPAIYCAVTPSHDAVANFHAILNAGPENINVAGRYGTALQRAAFFACEEFARELIAHGAAVNTADGDQMEHGTALHCAISARSESIVEFLLSRGANVGFVHNALGTALHHAVSSSSEFIVKILLNHKADVNFVHAQLGTALHCAVSTSVSTRSECIVKVLLNHGADVDLVHAQLGTALHCAVSTRCESIVKVLLSYGADVNLVHARLGTALHCAVSAKFESIVKLLLSHRADVDVAHSQVGTALHCAVAAGSESIVKLLLSHGANVNVFHSLVGTALHCAVTAGSEAIVRLLLSHGAIVDVVHNPVCTALHCAVAAESEAIVKLLLDYGASVNKYVHDKTGTVLQTAVQTGNESVVKLLLSSDADPRICGGEYGSPLHCAACLGEGYIAQMLMEHQPAIKDVVLPEYGTPLQCAFKHEQFNVVELLFEAGASTTGLPEKEVMRLEKKRGRMERKLRVSNKASGRSRSVAPSLQRWTASNDDLRRKQPDKLPESRRSTGPTIKATRRNTITGDV